MSRILVIGAGDLGRRIVIGLQRTSAVGMIVVAGRRRPPTVASGPDDPRVSHVMLNALDERACGDLIRSIRPDLIVQCAVATSPWSVAAALPQAPRGLAEVGFGLQLPFQLRIALRVARAAHDVGHGGPIVNCSYPDLTNAVLARAGCPVTIGIGNVAMVAACIESRLGASASQSDSSLVRVVAQHVHTKPALMCDESRIPASLHAWVFVGERAVRHDELAYAGVPVDWGIETNALAAATALPVICSLLPAGIPTRTSAPGPLGLIGGYPVRCGPSGVELDLPPDIRLASAVKFNCAAASLEGIGGIDADGTVTPTEHAARLLWEVAPQLSEPLRVQDVDERARLLDAILGTNAAASSNHLRG